MRILITGSKGVIGAALVVELKQRGHSVVGLDLSHDDGEVGWEHTMRAAEWSYARCDVGEFRQLERVFARVGPFDIVYHAAAEFGRWNGEDFYEQVWKSNAIGTKNVIRLQEKYRFKLVHFSSSEVYGDYEGLMREEILDQVPIRQMNDYAMSKWVNEMQVGNSRTMHQTSSVIVRLFNTYGPGEWYHPYRSVNAKFCYHALMGLPITVYRNHFRTSTYLADTVRTLANISERFEDEAVYNIGGSEYHDIETLADIVWDYTQADRGLIHYEDQEILTTRSKTVDISRAERELGHQQTIPLKVGIQQTIDWMRKYYGN